MHVRVHVGGWVHRRLNVSLGVGRRVRVCARAVAFVCLLAGRLFPLCLSGCSNGAPGQVMLLVRACMSVLVHLGVNAGLIHCLTNSYLNCDYPLTWLPGE